MMFGKTKPNVRMVIESLQIQRTFCAAVIFAYGVPCAIFFPRGSLNRREGYATDPSAALQQTSCLRQAARTGIGTDFLDFFITMPSRTARGVGVSRIVLYAW